jgi:hypothetical protein
MMVGLIGLKNNPVLESMSTDSCGSCGHLRSAGRLFSEPTLVKIAYAYEQATQHRRPPEAFSH